jgi:hypothetical protein
VLRLIVCVEEPDLLIETPRRTVMRILLPEFEAAQRRFHRGRTAEERGEALADLLRITKMIDEA